MAVGVSNQPPDVEHLELLLLERIAPSVGALPSVMTMDAGYWSGENAKAFTDQDIDAYISTGLLPHGQPPPTKRGPIPRDADAKARLARKIRSKKGYRIYLQRKAIVELVNRRSKRHEAYAVFCCRLKKVVGEWP